MSDTSVMNLTARVWTLFHIVVKTGKHEVCLLMCEYLGLLIDWCPAQGVTVYLVPIDRN